MHGQDVPTIIGKLAYAQTSGPAHNDPIWSCILDSTLWLLGSMCCTPGSLSAELGLWIP